MLVSISTPLSVSADYINYVNPYKTVYSVSQCQQTASYVGQYQHSTAIISVKRLLLM